MKWERPRSERMLVEVVDGWKGVEQWLVHKFRGWFFWNWGSGEVGADRTGCRAGVCHM
jgi:hypothetical protein